MDLYKITGPNGECLNGGSGSWDLPTATEPGAWWRVAGDIVACHNGLHLASREQLDRWLPQRDGTPYVIHRAETDGDILNNGDKYVVSAARLLPRRVPAPDLAAEQARFNDARNRAMTPANRARKRADRAFARLSPAQGYLAHVQGMTLPEGHPLRAEQDRYATAKATYNAAVRAAADRYDRAVAPAAKRYAAAVAAMIDGA